MTMRRSPQQPWGALEERQRSSLKLRDGSSACIKVVADILVVNARGAPSCDSRCLVTSATDRLYLSMHTADGP